MELLEIILKYFELFVKVITFIFPTFNTKKCMMSDRVCLICSNGSDFYYSWHVCCKNCQEICVECVKNIYACNMGKCPFCTRSWPDDPAFPRSQIPVSPIPWVDDEHEDDDAEEEQEEEQSSTPPYVVELLSDPEDVRGPLPLGVPRGNNPVLQRNLVPWPPQPLPEAERVAANLVTIRRTVELTENNAIRQCNKIDDLLELAGEIRDNILQECDDALENFRIMLSACPQPDDWMTRDLRENLCCTNMAISQAIDHMNAVRERLNSRRRRFRASRSRFALSAQTSIGPFRTMSDDQIRSLMRPARSLRLRRVRVRSRLMRDINNLNAYD